MERMKRGLALGLCLVCCLSAGIGMAGAEAEKAPAQRAFDRIFGGGSEPDTAPQVAIPAPEGMTRAMEMEPDEAGAYRFTLLMTPEEQNAPDLEPVLYLLKQEEDGGYRWIFRDAATTWDPGTGTVTFDGRVVCSLSEEGKPEYFLPAVHFGSVGDSESYYVGASYGYEALGSFRHTDWTVDIHRETGAFLVSEITPRDGKPFDPEGAAYVMFVSNTRMPTEDDAGRLLPYGDWDRGNLALGFDNSEPESLVFARVPLAELGPLFEEGEEQALYAQIYFYDMRSGEVQYPVTDLVRLDW